jgi:long-chain acyl-CoA synthetase
MGLQNIHIGDPMNKPWLQSYPPGVPAEINLAEHNDLVDVFLQGVKKNGSKPLFSNMGVDLSYNELDQKSKDFAAHLHSQGIAAGDRVAIMMPNLLQYPIALFGVLRLGCTVVNCNPLYTPRELEHQLKDSGAKAIVILENFATTLEQVLPKTDVKHVILAAVGDCIGLKGLLVNFVLRHVKKMVPAFNLPNATRFNAALSNGQGKTFPAPTLNQSSIAFLQYTGGTTGVSKGAILTHGNLIANILQVNAWLEGGPKSDKQEILIGALPLYHIFALSACMFTYLKRGAQIVLITNPKDIPGFIKTLSQYKFTVIPGVNTLFNALVNHPDFAKLDFSSCSMGLGGGMAVQRATADKWKKITGTTLVEAYGLTETSPGLTINPPTLKDYNGSIGLPIPSTEVMIRGDNGQEMPMGERGEICARGPQVMQGYWQRPDETAKVIDKDGWFATGDVGVMDDKGYFKIVDRIKDMILVSGFNVYPNEVEDAVALHPGVLEVAAIGLPDDKSGEAVKIFVVRKDAALTTEAVMNHCREQLTGYKCPKHIEFRDELPKTNVGKILRRALRDENLAKLAAK